MNEWINWNENYNYSLVNYTGCRGPNTNKSVKESGAMDKKRTCIVDQGKDDLWVMWHINLLKISASLFEDAIAVQR